MTAADLRVRLFIAVVLGIIIGFSAAAVANAYVTPPENYAKVVKPATAVKDIRPKVEEVRKQNEASRASLLFCKNIRKSKVTCVWRFTYDDVIVNGKPATERWTSNTIATRTGRWSELLPPVPSE